MRRTLRFRRRAVRIPHVALRWHRRTLRLGCRAERLNRLAEGGRRRTLGVDRRTLRLHCGAVRCGAGRYGWLPSRPPVMRPVHRHDWCDQHRTQQGDYRENTDESNHLVPPCPCLVWGERPIPNGTEKWTCPQLPLPHRLFIAAVTEIVKRLGKKCVASFSGRPGTGGVLASWTLRNDRRCRENAPRPRVKDRENGDGARFSHGVLRPCRPTLARTAPRPLSACQKNLPHTGWWLAVFLPCDCGTMGSARRKPCPEALSC